MAILRSIPKRLRGASYRGRIMIDSVRGVLRVRQWPKKRGPPRSALQAWWVDWFVQANRLAKYVDGASMARAIEMTKGSGLYPRDVLLMAMRGRLYNWIDSDGWRWYSMAAIGDISESLDVLAQSVGSVLVRAVDRWRSPPPGVLNDVLTYKGPLQAPLWQAPGGGGGLVQEELVGTPIVPDGTVSSYDLDVSLYVELQISWNGLGFAAVDFPALRLSTDGGATFKAAVTDYRGGYFTFGSDSNGNVDHMRLGTVNRSTDHDGYTRLTNLKEGRAVYGTDAAQAATFVRRQFGTAAFDGPITHIRFFSKGGNNLNAGTIRVVGLR